MYGTYATNKTILYLQNNTYLQSVYNVYNVYNVRYLRY